MTKKRADGLRRRGVLTALGTTGLASAAALAAKKSAAQPQTKPSRSQQPAGQPADAARPANGGGNRGYTPVHAPSVKTLPYKLVDGAKEFRLVAEPISQTFASGMLVKCWGYNGGSPGPTIEVMEGDRLRVLLHNKLALPTTLHWRGLQVPCGMDGVAGLTQPAVQPGETYVYEFTASEAGTYLYHPQSHGRTQLGMGMHGFVIVHPKRADKVDRDFALLTHGWAIEPGTHRPNPHATRDWNTFTLNGRVAPAVPSLVVRTGQRVRIRFGNLSNEPYPIYLHGHRFRVTATEGGAVSATAQWPATTLTLPVGATRDIEFRAERPGDWALHAQVPHHALNATRHALPLVSHSGGPGPAAHGSNAGNNTPPRHLPGRYGNIDAGGMFTVLKVRDNIRDYADPGWYTMPSGSQARRLTQTKPSK